MLRTKGVPKLTCKLSTKVLNFSPYTDLAKSCNWFSMVLGLVRYINLQYAEKYMEQVGKCQEDLYGNIQATTTKIKLDSPSKQSVGAFSLQT